MAFHPTPPELFGHMPDGAPVLRLTLADGPLRVRLLTLGAAIHAIDAPDREGHHANVVLGLATLADTIAHSPHFGAIPGRYAGRIARGRFTLDGVAYQLACNNGPNAIHGGPSGFGRRAWTLADHGPRHATMTLTSPDGEEGYPGELTVTATYTLADQALTLALAATTTRPTILNLTNHAYFNLAGEGSGSVLGHELTIHADHVLPIEADSIPTGEIRPVEGTVFDFRTPHAIGARIRAPEPQLLLGRGYDHAYLLPGTGLREAAFLHDPGSGRTLTVSTTEPVMHLYTANMLTGALAGPSGRAYRQSDAVCLEAQHPADSPNHPAFPSTTLRPATPYAATTVFRFGTDRA